MGNTGSGLQLRRLSLTAPEGEVLFPPMDLNVRPGDIIAVMGTSGVGKSSLLAAICGSLDPRFGLEGDIRLDGRSLLGLPIERRHVGILFQDALLFPHLSVMANLLFALPSGGSSADRRGHCEAALSDADLTGYAKAQPNQLSGGQAARVALLRTLLARPRALLLDEAFAKLDDKTRRQIQDLVRKEVSKRAIPCLTVTHDPADAAALQAQILKLESPGEPVSPSPDVTSTERTEPVLAASKRPC
ncbi:MAG: ATP-binding cassette domain-containing protein [Geminicoccaceae bacterium]